MTGHGGASDLFPGAGLLLLNLLLIVGACYLSAVRRLRRRGDTWPLSRSLAAIGGLLCIAVAVVVAPGAASSFPVHVVQHLLATMLGPLLLALSAPITLALRVISGSARRVVLGVLHHPAVGLIGTAPAVLILSLGALYGFYLTPLFGMTHQQPVLGAAVHLHMFLAGCLFSWYLVGPDPMTHRPGTGKSLVVLLVAAAGHDTLAKLMYARQLPATGGTPEESQLGAQIMYYGGSAIEFVLAVVLMAGWYRRGGRELRRDQRRSGPVDPGSGAVRRRAEVHTRQQIRHPTGRDRI